jgi:lysophospholipase L1-like esterase
MKAIASIASVVVLLSTSAWAQVPLVGLGDSIGEGVQSGDASEHTQPFSYLPVMARQIGVPLPLPLIATTPVGVIGSTVGRIRINPFLPAANLAVSGADVSSILQERADGIRSTETDLVLSPRIGSQVEVAERMKPAAVVCFIGNNDVLGAALHFNKLDASQMTSVAEFTAFYRALMTRMQALGKPVVVGTIPNITRIAFLLDNTELTRFTGVNYGLASGHYTSLIAGLLLRLRVAGPSLLQDPNWVLDPAEIAKIQQRTEELNRVIVAEANARNFAIANVFSLFEYVATRRPVLAGVPLTTGFLGGIFSLDGVHPSNIGHAVLANEFLHALNTRYGSNFPLIGPVMLNVIAARDPFVDLNGNGVVAGRPFAGLLETLAPFLGLSGDDEAAVTATRKPGGYSAQAFLAEYRRLTGRTAMSDVTAETIAALRGALGIRALLGSKQ